jgi:hypothetical protein
VKGTFQGPKLLDGQKVETITAFLFHGGDHNDPKVLTKNAGKSFQGSIVLGMGFTFDDTDTKGVATKLVEMRQLIEMNSNNAEVIFPYIGYSEVANDPTLSYHRYVINFGGRSEEQCKQSWPELMSIVETKVKPERMAQNDRGAKEKWWQFIRPRPELHAAISKIGRVLVAGSQASSQYVFAFLPQGMVYSSNLSIVAADTYSAFATLQSGIHEAWARFFMSTLEDRLAYTPTTCFEPFPFIENWDAHPALEAAGKAYYEFRADLMVRNDEGLTKTYNRFHDPEENDPDILKLRELHADMDRAVLDAYGWSDIPTECEFLLDYEDDEEETSSRRKKPWRYRWPDEVREEVLARLLELNAVRAKEEVRSGAAVTKKRSRKQASKHISNEPETGDLFS